MTSESIREHFPFMRKPKRPERHTNSVMPYRNVTERKKAAATHVGLRGLFGKHETMPADEMPYDQT